MVSFVIAVMMCAGANCEIVQPEPDTSYPTYEACATASESKKGTFQAYLNQRADGREQRVVCLKKDVPVVDVEELAEALETTVVRAEPSGTSGYVGLLEKGERALVNGRVLGTQWLRLVLKDGSTGFVFSDRLRMAGLAEPAVPRQTTPQPPGAEVQVPPSVTAKPAQAGPVEKRDCERCPVLVAIPAGTLTMGSGDDPTEKPVHKVAIPVFLLAKHELSAAEWAACVDGGGCSYRPPPVDSDLARTAMTNLSFTDAMEYIAWLRKETGKPYRLPSEAEWEYAARAGTTTRYPWGDQVGTGHADCEGCGGAHDQRRPQAIDAFPANRFGVSGMGGGVAEWVEDCWHASYQGAPRDGSPWRTPNCTSHVLRGGSWTSGPKDITVSSRNFYEATVRYPANGLRVAQDGTAAAP